MPSRRDKGTGSIYQRADGKWMGVVELPAVRGKRTRRSVSAPTKREAQRRRNELEARLNREAASGPAPERLTVAELLDRWLTVNVEPRLAPKSLMGYQDAVHRLTPLVGDIRLDLLSPLDIETAYQAMHADGYAPQTVHNTHRAFKTALNQAVRWELLSRNPMDRVRPPKIGPSDIHPLDAAQTQTLLSVTADLDCGPLYAVAVTTGMRQGELLGLGWSDVDLSDGSLRVGRTLQYQRGVGLVLKSAAKTPGSRRRIVLSKRAIQAFIEQKRRLMERRTALGADWSEMGLVFPGPDGTPREPTAVTRRLHRILKRAGLPDVTFHDLRHTAATLLLLKGTHPKLVSELLGHSSITMTLNTYSAFITPMHGIAAADMDAILGSNSDDWLSDRLSAADATTGETTLDTPKTASR